MFAVYRNHKDRIISGIAEDLFSVTLQKNPNLHLLSDSEKKEQCLVELTRWCLEPTFQNIDPTAYHYGSLADYINPRHLVNVINWIRFEDLHVLHKIINYKLQSELDLIPFVFNERYVNKFRPSKEWYYYQLSNFPERMNLIHRHIDSQAEMITIQLRDSIQ